jgi:hypothetical protein
VLFLVGAGEKVRLIGAAVSHSAALVVFEAIEGSTTRG